MFYNVLKVKDLVMLDEKPCERRTLMESASGSVSAVALRKHEIIDTQTATNNALVVVIDGELEIHFAAQQFVLNKGEIIMFKKDDQHKVLAKKDSEFLIVKI